MRFVKIFLCAALLMTGSLWLADSALAKPAYCYCDYCPQATQHNTCTDPITKDVYDYLDWCYYNCFQEVASLEPGSELESASSTKVACDVAPATTDPSIEFDLEPQPAL